MKRQGMRSRMAASGGVALLVLGSMSGARADEHDEARPGTELIAAQVRALETPPLAPGEAGELSLVLLEAPDRDMPLSVRIEPGALELLDDRLDWSAVADPLALQPRLRAAFRAPEQPGRHEVRASVGYCVCDEDWCRCKHGELAWTVVVVEPAN